MDENNYEQKYEKYLKKNKYILDKLRNHQSEQEQEVRYIAIKISDDTLDEDKIRSVISMFDEIINEGERGRNNVLRILRLTKDGHLKHKQLKNKNKKLYGVDPYNYISLNTFAELKYDKLDKDLKFLLQNIRGKNTLLNFDLSYSHKHSDYRRYSKGVTRVYFLQLLPPREEDENYLREYRPESENFVYWNYNENNSSSASEYKWLSENNKWRWDSTNKVWMTNDIRPWYFANFPHKSRIKSMSEWDESIDEIVRHQQMLQRELELEIAREEKIKKINDGKNNTMFTKIKNFMFGKKVNENKIVPVEEDKTDPVTL